MRPGKLRLVVLRHTSPSPSTPMWPPRHAPQVAVVHAAPAARNVRINPSRSAWIATWCDEGVMISRTPSATLCPSSTAAARRRSVMREFVHEPMNTWSSLVPATSDRGAYLPGDIGLATPGSTAAASNSKTFSYSAVELGVARPMSPDNYAPLSEVAGTRLDQVFIGSCTNSRITDLRRAAAVLANRKVAPGVRLIITPSSHQVAIQAEKEGLIGTFMAAGAAWTTATCGACLGGHMGVLGEGEVCLSTTNRNFPGRMGHPKAQVYLSNPAVAAASAVTGVISHPGEVLDKMPAGIR